MKKGSLPLNYVFIVFISVIAVFVIVGMLTKWSLNTGSFMCQLTGECDETNLIDKQTITVDTPERFAKEAIKQSKLCYEKSKNAETPGELCYSIKCECSPADIPTPTHIHDEYDGLSQSWKDKINKSEFDVKSYKAIIEFDYNRQKVFIR